MTPLDPGFLTLPLAHRGLHDIDAGRPENSRAAIEAACQAGYGIEIDLQPSRDGVAMVFHDAELDRLTAQSGPVSGRTAADLAGVALRGSAETIPTLREILALVAGRVPLLIEIKDQGGDPKSATLPLVDAALDTLGDYTGPVAFMSFNPLAVAHGARRRPDLAWGITSGHDTPLWPDHPELDAALIRAPIDPRDHGASFLSHGLQQHDADWLAPLAAQGVPILSWTIRNPQDARLARSFATNITFEGYLPDPSP